MNFIKKITTLFMFAAAAFAVSCSEVSSEDIVVSDEAAVSEDIFSEREISFSIAELPTTRGAILSGSTFEEFEIYATFSDYPTVISTRTMSVDENGLWVLNSPLTMPMTGSATIYAVNSQDGEVTFNSDGSVSFEMSDVTEQPSLLMSVPITVAEDDTDLNVAFSFKHALAAVGFKAYEGDYKLTTIEVSNIYDEVTIAYGDSYSTSSYTYGDKTTTIYETGSLDDGDNYILIPAQSMEGAIVTTYMSYYDEDGEKLDSYSSTVTLPANADLETPGMVYTYNVANSTYVAPDYITPGEGYEDTDDNGAYELDDIVVGGDVTANVSTNSTLTWASSDTSVATVDSDGVVTGVGGGTATITATSATDGVVVKFEVTVLIPIYAANLSSTTLTLEEDATGELYATAVYEGATSPYQETFTVTSWSSTSTTVAKVASTAITTGTVTGVAAGTATITVTITGDVSGNVRSTTCAVTVEAGAKFNYNLIFAGDYINSSGTVLSSSSGAIGMVYYVDASEGYALLVSPTCSSQYYWASTTTTKFGATNTECGYYNGATTYSGTAIGDITSAYAINKVWTLGTLSAFMDDNDVTKGHWYLPANQELAKMRTSSTLWTKIMTYTGTTGYNTFWSSTEASASNAYMTFNDINSSDYSSYSKQYSSLWPTRGLFRVMKF